MKVNLEKLRPVRIDLKTKGLQIGRLQIIENKGAIRDKKRIPSRAGGKDFWLEGCDPPSRGKECVTY